MNEQEYLKSRVDDQIDWYNAKSLSAHRAYKSLQIFQIAGAAMVPFLASYAGSVASIPIVLGVLGVLLAVAGGLLALFQYQERWIEYRTTCESLKQERYLFLTKTEPYNGENSLQIFVKQVEGLISRETSAWAQTARTVKASEAVASDKPE